MADGDSTGNGTMSDHIGAEDGGAHTSQRQGLANGRGPQNSGPRITNGAGPGAIEHNPQVQRDAAYYRAFLSQLLGVVGSQDDATVSRMITFIRSGASQQDIWAALSQFSAEENGSRNRRATRGGGNSGEETEGRRR